MKSLIVFCILLISCEEATLRERVNRPSEDGAETPGFDLETTVSVSAGSAATIEISDTTVTIQAGSTKKDAEIRLRTLKSVPPNDKLAELGKAKGDIVEITMYDKATGEIFGSELLDAPYEFSQKLNDVSNAEDISYIVMTGQSTADEEVIILSNETIETSASLGLLNAVVVRFSSNLTNAIVIPIEISDDPINIDIIRDSSTVSNAGGRMLATNIPDAPTDAHAIAGSSESISIDWTDNASDEASFKIERSVDDTSYIAVATVAANVTSYSDITVTASTTYYYRLRACNNEGCSDNAATGGVTSLDSASIPAAPSDLNAVAAGSDVINLNWTDNANNETSLIVERSTDGSNFMQLATVATDSISHVDATSSASTTYYYRLKSCSSAGCSGFTEVRSATTSSSTVHRVFVTSTIVSCNLGSLSGADGLCQNDANIFSLGGTWKAILSDSTANARDRLTISGEIFNMNSEKVATSAAALWNADNTDLLMTAEYTASGGSSGTVKYWTGSLSNGSVEVDAHCNNWTGGMYNGRVGDSSRIDEMWITAEVAPYTCASAMRLLCIDGQ